MAVCRFCAQEFGSKQAVRAHLKACAAYLGRFTRQPTLPEANADLPAHDRILPSLDALDEAFDPVTKMRQQVAAEKLRLTLREIRQAHGELDAREDARRKASSEQAAREAQVRAATEREREAARARAASEASAHREAEEAKERRKAARREVIQQVKAKVVDEWWGRYRISSELKAQILQAIESTLPPLAVDELPRAELVQIAEGVRDRLKSHAEAAQNAAAARAQQQQALQRYGLEYARRELSDIEGLDWSERLRIESLVQEELKELTGDESRVEVMAWVDEILEEEGFEDDDEDDTE